MTACMQHMRNSRYNALAEAAKPPKRIPSPTVQFSRKLDSQTLLVSLTAAITVKNGARIFLSPKKAHFMAITVKKNCVIYLTGQLDYLGDPSPSPLD